MTADESSLNAQALAGLPTRLKALRTRAGVTQVALAKQAGVDHVYYSKIERGLHTPSLSILLRLSDAFGVTLAYLVGGATLSPEAEQTFQEFLESPVAHNITPEIIHEMRGPAAALFASTVPTRQAWEHLFLALQHTDPHDVARALGADPIRPPKGE